MRTGRSTHRWAVGVGLGVIVAAVVVSTALQERVARRIDAAAAVVSHDVAPAVSLLGELRLLTSYVFERTRAEVQGVAWSPAASPGGQTITLEHPPPASVEDAQRRLQRLIDDSPVLVAPGDTRQMGLLLRDRGRQFDKAIRRTRDQIRKGDRQAASRTLESANGLAVTIHLAATSLLEQEATAADSAAREIEGSRRLLRHLQRTLLALVALLAAAAALLAFWTLRFVTRAHELRAQAIAARADELEAFAGRVAHDVLGPLTAVSSALFIAQKRGGNALVQDSAARGEKSLKRVQQIVDGLLSFARAGARGEADACAEVRPIVAGLVEELAVTAAEARADLSVAELPECAVRCSDGVLISMLSNLLRNALKYLGAAETREVTLRVHASDESVLFEVSDTGPGVPPDLRERIFEPYVRAPGTEHKPGIGLGLATVRRLAAAHGGRADYRARRRRGSIFSFELPRADGPGKQLARTESPQAAGAAIQE